jgi:hypothetical protein
VAGGKIFVVLADGWTHEIAAVVDGFEHRAFPPGAALGGAPPAYQSSAARLESEAAGFVGSWRLNREPDGSFLYILLRSDGTAFSTVAGLTTGTWQVVDGGAKCQWPDGWVDRLAMQEGQWHKRSWVGGDESTPADLAEAVRVGESPFEFTP